MKLLKKLLTNKIVGISSGGGHLTELFDAIPSNCDLEINYITFRNGHTVKSLINKKHFFVIDPHVSKVKFIINFIQSFYLFVCLRPKIIISTGAGIAISFMLIGKLFGSKLIFIESGARIFHPSKTGKFIYKYADLFLVQYDSLKDKYPNSIVASLQ